MLLGPEESERWLARERLLLDQSVERLRQRHPELKVTDVLSTSRRADALLGAAPAGAMLVLGTGHETRHSSSHLGSLATAVVHRSGCPVMLVPPPVGV
jgi:nucleotide-binding universal stress UspA family protein